MGAARERGLAEDLTWFSQEVERRVRRGAVGEGGERKKKRKMKARKTRVSLGRVVWRRRRWWRKCKGDFSGLNLPGVVGMLSRMGFRGDIFGRKFGVKLGFFGKKMKRERERVMY
ncbi:hypothetical protein HanRHA438_Chr17g0811881 [Helianthus annuus]|nr:hypothetical protein HanRHA438_Chr17g0811881 [Helianthus annuus]